MPVTPHLLVLQTESVYITFPKGTVLPFRIHTNNVANCLGVALYSPAKGVVYFGHLYLAGILDSNFKQYKAVLEQIIEQHDLTSDNTFVALVGANSDGIYENGNFDERGAQEFKKFFLKHFNSVTDVLAKNRSIVCCLELSADKLEVIDVDYGRDNDTHKELTYHQIPVPTNNMFPNNQFISMKLYVHGNLAGILSRERIQQYNEALTNESKIQALNDMVINTAKERLINHRIGGSDMDIVYNQNINNLKIFFSNNHQTKVSTSIYECAISKPVLFQYIKDNIPMQDYINMKENEIDDVESQCKHMLRLSTNNNNQTNRNTSQDKFECRIL